MLAFQAGDRASFGRIVEEYRRPVIGHVYRLVRDIAIAEELSQEVFLRVYRTRDYQPTAGNSDPGCFALLPICRSTGCAIIATKRRISAWIIRRPRHACASRAARAQCWKST